MSLGYRTYYTLSSHNSSFKSFYSLSLYPTPLYPTLRPSLCYSLVNNLRCLPACQAFVLCLFHERLQIECICEIKFIMYGMWQDSYKSLEDRTGLLN